MVTRCRPELIGLSLLLALAVMAPARAEVSAEVDLQGNYLRTIIMSRASVKDVDIWSVLMRHPRHVPLNPLGDANGDLWPVIAEDASGPWVVWSRWNGTDYDLAWSRWGRESWEEVQWIEEVPRAGDDLDPDLTIDDSGRSHVTWWTDEAGVGQVYLSMYLDTRWMSPYVVSDPGVDSRDPSLTVNDDGSITITYLTPGGEQSKTVWIISGHSINDDFDPFNSLESSSMSH